MPLGTDYKKAKDKLNRYRAGDPVLSRVPLSDAFGQWLKLYVATRRNEKGQELAETWKDHYLCRYFTGTLGSITGDSIRAYRLWLEKQKVGEETLSANTVARIMSDLRAFLNWGQGRGAHRAQPVPQARHATHPGDRAEGLL